MNLIKNIFLIFIFTTQTINPQMQTPYHEIKQDDDEYNYLFAMPTNQLINNIDQPIIIPQPADENNSTSTLNPITLQNIVHALGDHRDQLTNTQLQQIQEQAQTLFEESLITPDMQYFIWKATHPITEDFTINIMTGKILTTDNTNQHFSTVTNIIQSTIDETIKKHALHAALEALRIAKFSAALDIAYDNPTYLFFGPHISSTYLVPSIDPALLEELMEQEKTIKTALAQLRGWTDFFSSWIPKSVSKMFTLYSRKNSTEQQLPVLITPINRNNLEAPQNYKNIPDNIMASIMKYYNYKQITNTKNAANLLFQQCFIAQQNSSNPLFFSVVPQQIPANLTITSATYLYDWFFTFDNLCSYITNAVTTHQLTPQQAHQEFLNMRKAVQTALFIANKNSSFSIGYILPTSITQYLDVIVKELMKYDVKLSGLSKNSAYGATADDQYFDLLLTKISYIAGGIIVLTALYTDYKYGFGTSVSWLFNGLFNVGKSAKNLVIATSTPKATNSAASIPQATKILQPSNLNQAAKQLEIENKIIEKIENNILKPIEIITNSDNNPITTSTTPRISLISPINAPTGPNHYDRHN